MNNSDRLYFSKFAMEPDIESILDFDELSDFDIHGDTDQSRDETGFDNSDEYFWDDI